MNHPAPQPAEVAALMRGYSTGWQIEHDAGMDVWTAVRKSPDGKHIRILVAHDPGGLAAKLADAEADDPGPDNPPGVAQSGGGWISGPCT